MDGIADLLRSAGRAAAVLAEARPVRRLRIYGGEEVQRRSDVLILPWRAIHEHAWASP